MLIPKLGFSRLVKEVLSSLSEDRYRITSDALDALQQCTEAFFVGLFEDANTLAFHRGRITVTTKDMKILRTLQKWPC